MTSNEKISATLKKLWQDSEYREHMVNVHKGRHPSIETRAKIGAAEKGKRNYNYGKHLTEEQRKKISMSVKALWQDPEYRARVSATHIGKPPGNKGRPLSEEQKAKISASGKRRGQDPEYRAKQSVAHMGKPSPMKNKHLTEETKAKLRAATKKQWQDPEHQAKMSAIRKAQWRDPEYTKMMCQARSIKPNKAELKLQEILDKYFTGEWKFVGDGQVNLGGRLPDFMNVNGKKEVIELFGAHWHPLFDAAQRKEHYRQYGFRVAIIWEDELKDEERLVKTLKRKLR